MFGQTTPADLPLRGDCLISQKLYVYAGRALDARFLFAERIDPIRERQTAVEPVDAGRSR